MSPLPFFILDFWITAGAISQPKIHYFRFLAGFSGGSKTINPFLDLDQDLSYNDLNEQIYAKTSFLSKYEAQNSKLRASLSARHTTAPPVLIRQ